MTRHLPERRVTKQMKNNKASGSDGSPHEMYNHGGEILAHHLHDFIQKIWNPGEIPRELKDAMVVPISKNGDRADSVNFRGISLL